jgi:hypothetical protein
MQSAKPLSHYLLVAFALAMGLSLLHNVRLSQVSLDDTNYRLEQRGSREPGLIHVAPDSRVGRLVERQGHREVIPFRYTEILASGYDRILSRQLAVMDRIERIHQHPRLQECLRSILLAACRHY